LTRLGLPAIAPLVPTTVTSRSIGFDMPLAVERLEGNLVRGAFLVRERRPVVGMVDGLHDLVTDAGRTRRRR
jgi:hypothetical protein